LLVVTDQQSPYARVVPTTFHIRTARTTLHIPWENAHALLGRLRSVPGGSVVAGELRGSHAVAEIKNKQLLLDEMEAWLLATSVDTLGPELIELRDELMRDLKIPPFDT
jgi:hypothetical protein